LPRSPLSGECLLDIFEGVLGYAINASISAIAGKSCLLSYRVGWRLVVAFGVGRQEWRPLWINILGKGVRSWEMLMAQLAIMGR
jgi:hypothetical protein